jgi:putative MATE family efflux protein
MMARKPALSMTEGPLLGVIARVALPIVLSNLLNVTYQLINALWVGRLGGAAIAAVAASAPLFGVLISLGSGLATAGSVLIAQYAGAKRGEKVDHIAAQTLLMVCGVALAFGLLGFLTARPVLRLVGVDQAIEDLTTVYLNISYAGMAPIFLFMAIQGMLQAVGEVRFAFYVMLGSVLLNAALDPLLIFGIGSWNGWGVAGAATATVIAEVAALVLAFGRLLGGKSALHLKRAHFSPDTAHMLRALGIGLPASIEQATRTFGSLVLMSLAAQFGTEALATYGLGTRILLLFFLPMLGLSVATTTVVGQNIGAGRMDRAEAAGRLCAWASFGILTVVGLLLIPATPTIMTAITPTEPVLIAKASRFVYIFAPFLGLFAVPQVLCGVFRGAGSTRQAMGISLTMQWVFQLPAAWLIALLTPLGVLGVWWSYPIGNALASALAIGWFIRGPWRRSLVEPR